MSRAAGLCRFCGGPKRGRAARTAAPIAQCFKCNSDICENHYVWSEQYYCKRCAKELGIKGISK